MWIFPFDSVNLQQIFENENFMITFYNLIDYKNDLIFITFLVSYCFTIF